MMHLHNLGRLMGLTHRHLISSRHHVADLHILFVFDLLALLEQRWEHFLHASVPEFVFASLTSLSLFTSWPILNHVAGMLAMALSIIRSPGQMGSVSGLPLPVKA
jgi:hypothetical protein